MSLLDVGALALAAVVTWRLLKRVDDIGRPGGAGRRGKGDAQEKAKELAKKLKGRTLKDGSPLSVKLKEHELEVASDVIAPHEIDVTFDDIGGLSEIGRALQRNIILPFTRPDIFRQSKLLRPPKGILLHGPPGTGKTLLARAVAREAKFTFIALNPARLLSKWYGESNRLAEAYFSLANKLAPSILFIDEIDCLFRTRQGGGNGEHEATSILKAQILSLWDGLLSPAAPQIVVIAATNRPDVIDPAVSRRLPLSFEVPLPEVSGRTDVLRLLLKDDPLAQGIDIDALARATEGYSGSDLDQLVKTAAMRSLEEALAREEEEKAAAKAAVQQPASVAAESDALDAVASAAERPNATAIETAHLVEGTASTSATASISSTHSEAAATSTAPPLRLRPLTLDDFLRARNVVRPTRGRFAGVHHDVHLAPPAAMPIPTATYDDELYD